jgi:transcriptional regulator with GAF, ATPase, and Fis domain
VQRGEFRADLYARLAGHVVVVPPLRQRRADLGVLVAALLERYAPNGGRTTSFAPQALRTFFLHDWPQNVRELEMALRLAGARAGWSRIELVHLPEALQRTLHVEAHRERAQLTELMRTHEGNVTAVARELSTSRSHVHRLARRHGLELQQFRR